MHIFWWSLLWLFVAVALYALGQLWWLAHRDKHTEEMLWRKKIWVQYESDDDRLDFLQIFEYWQSVLVNEGDDWDARIVQTSSLYRQYMAVDKSRPIHLLLFRRGDTEGDTFFSPNLLDLPHALAKFLSKSSMRGRVSIAQSLTMLHQDDRE